MRATSSPITASIPKFFFQFPPQRVARLLSFFNLAAGELPFQRHDLVAGPLAGQDLVVFRG